MLAIIPVIASKTGAGGRARRVAAATGRSTDRGAGLLHRAGIVCPCAPGAAAGLAVRPGTKGGCGPPKSRAPRLRGVRQMTPKAATAPWRSDGVRRASGERSTSRTGRGEAFDEPGVRGAMLTNTTEIETAIPPLRSLTIPALTDVSPSAQRLGRHPRLTAPPDPARSAHPGFQTSHLRSGGAGKTDEPRPRPCAFVEGAPPPRFGSGAAAS